MIKFILNNTEISTAKPAAMPLLEFIRYQQHLTGTKTGCNEGDCGACTILVGELVSDELRYRSFTSCLTPLGNVRGKHIVTVEGINMEGLNPIQQAICDESGTQCGFCTPGFVMSLAGFCLSHNIPSLENAIASIDGNICRCTGYKSLERAAEKVAAFMKPVVGEDPATFVADQNILPAYFKNIRERLITLGLSLNGTINKSGAKGWMVAGGTDLYVQKHDDIKDADIQLIFDSPLLNGISQQGNRVIIGAAATVTDLLESQVIKAHFPRLAKHVKLVSSTPIRNMATIAGNIINASPIGDFTIFFLALDAMVVLSDGEKEREIPLRKLYKGYKKLDKTPEEFVQQIWFLLPGQDSHFNFEKVSKRTHLDIASVNTAMLIELNDAVVTNAGLSAGGVGPVPAYLEKTSGYLIGKQLSENLMEDAIEMAQTEITPISDARGSEAYKRLLLSQLIKAHFIELFPRIYSEQLLVL